MVKVIKTGEVPIEPEKEYQCPRGCGKLRYGRSFQYLKKENQCKKCKGLMLSLNEIQKNGEFRNKAFQQNENT